MQVTSTLITFAIQDKKYVDDNYYTLSVKDHINIILYIIYVFRSKTKHKIATYFYK